MRTEDNPRGRLIEALLSLTFVAHPYRTPDDRLAERRREGGRETCLEFFRTYYVPNNVVISIAGDFDADDAIARIRKHYGGLGARRRAAAQPDRGAARSTASGARSCTLPVRAPLVGAAWHAPKSGPPRRPGPRRALRDPLRRPHQPAAAQARLRSAGGAVRLRRLLGARARRALLRGRRACGPARTPSASRRCCSPRSSGCGEAPPTRARAREGEARLRGRRCSGASAPRTPSPRGTPRSCSTFGRIRTPRRAARRGARRDRRRRAARRADLPRSRRSGPWCTCCPPPGLRRGPTR